MQEYLEHSALSQFLDAAGLRILMLIVCLGWFILLWGLSVSALTAGGALYFLCLMVYKKRRDGKLLQKEKKLRQQIGGELALERMTTEPESKTHFESALLLSVSYPLTMDRICERGVICQYRNKTVLTAFCSLPAADQLDPRTVLSFQRAIKEEKAEKGILCIPCGVSGNARAQAENDPPVTILPREKMVSLLGRQFPATDEQLIALGKRKRQHAPLKKWFLWILDEKRAARYVLYGSLLLALYLITHLFYYALPGLICVFLAAACRCVNTSQEDL